MHVSSLVFGATPMSAFPSVQTPASAPSESTSFPTLPILREVPALLQYRSAADPDAEFIPKTVAGFILGALAMFACLDLAEALLMNRSVPFSQQLPELVQHFAFMLGITGVAASLLLVGLKVRADHVEEQLFARHWLNSISTGTVYAIMIWGPWLLASQGFHINRFVVAGIWMLLMAFPAVAAKWTIGPQPAVGVR